MPAVFDCDHAQRRIYPVHGAYLPVHRAVQVDLEVLEILAAEHNTPHFMIQDYVKSDLHGFKEEVNNWKLHFTHLPHTGLVIAYEKKTQRPEPEERGVSDVIEVKDEEGHVSAVIV